MADFKPTFEHSQGKAYFNESPVRQNLVSGENIATSFSKIKKWFSDLEAIITPISESDYESLTVKDKPLYFIYPDS